MNLKKLKLFTFLPLILFSCVNESNESTEQDQSIFLRNSIMEIEWEETPELTEETISLIGFQSLKLDNSKSAFLDTDNSILVLPYDEENSILNSPLPNQFVSYGIKIAKKKVKPGSGCSSCVDCIGFRCGTTGSVSTYNQERINTEIANSIESDSRNQNFYIKINKFDKTIEFHFFNKIMWDRF